MMSAAGLIRAVRTGVIWILLMAALAAPVSAENRLALVIGNAAYTRVPGLANPEKDAALIARLLREQGFEVTGGSNLDLAGMREKVQQFAKKLAGAGSDAAGVIYYAGHGIQVHDVNYLVPVDAALKSVLDVKTSTVDLNWMLEVLAAADNAINIVILDACRDNPFQISLSGTRGGARGLAKVDASQGTLIAYATAPGQTAADGVGENSPFTKALAEVLPQPGLTVEQVFKRVRVKVHEETKGKQLPWETTSLVTEFYFTPQKGSVPQTSPAPSPEKPEIVTPVPPKQNDGISQDARIAFYRALEQNTLDGYEDFLAKYPNDPKAKDVREIVRSMSDENFWQRSSKENTLSAYQRYMRAFPKGTYVDEAGKRIAALSSTPAPAPPAEVSDCDAPHGSYRVVGVRSNDVLNIRSGPSANYGIIGHIPPDGTGIGITRCNGGRSWCSIKYRCNSGWVAARFLASGAAAPAQNTGGARYRVVNVASYDVLNMRASPNGRAAKVGEIPHNARDVVVQRCQHVSKYTYKWCYVSYAGSSGWAYGKFLANVYTNASP